MIGRILRIVIALGVPSITLGVFYLLLRGFSFQFEIITSTWAAIIAIVFLVIVGGVTLFALNRYAPPRDVTVSTINTGGLQISKIVVSIVVSIFATGILILIVVSLLAVKLLSPEAIPTATPLAFATAAPGETLILIATFHSTTDTNTEAYKKIQRVIEAEVGKLGEQKLRVAVEPVELAADQRTQAEALGNRYNADIVIWGEDTGVQIIVNFINLKEPKFAAATAQIIEEERVQLVNPEAYQQFILHDLPSHLMFLALFTVGQSYYINQDYSQAIRVIETAITSLTTHATPTIDRAKPPGLANAYFLIAWLYQVQSPNDLNKAIKNYNEAIQLDPGYVRAYYNRGVAYATKGDLDRAIEDYTQTIRLDSSYVGAYHNRGVAYATKGDLEQAIKDYTQTIRLDPDRAVVYFNRGLVHSKKGDFEQAIQDYHQAITQGFNLAVVYYSIGNTYGEKGDLDQAIRAYTQAIKLDPNYVHAYNNRGFSIYRKGSPELAIQDYDQAIKLDPTFGLTYYNRGNAYYAKGESERAIQDYDQAIKLDPKVVGAYNALCWTYAVRQKPKVALEYCQQAINIDPNPYFFDTRGLTYALLGDFHTARNDFQRYVDALKKSTDPERYLDLEKREAWIAMLETEKNPFTGEVLNELLKVPARTCIILYCWNTPLDERGFEFSQ